MAQELGDVTKLSARERNKAKRKAKQLKKQEEAEVKRIIFKQYSYSNSKSTLYEKTKDIIYCNNRSTSIFRQNSCRICF